jgi:polysaccharide export outer membrane protein
VADSIEVILSEYVREPVVTVTVTGMGSNEYLTRVRITGAVSGPSSIPYRPGMTVLDVILDAGGVTEFANPRRARIYRATGDRLDVRLDKILQDGDMSTNYALRPGDVITVPQRIF